MKKNELKKPALIQHDKDINKLFISNPVRRKILELFLSGGRYSVTDLSVLLHIPDPRSHIRYIRGAGISISDYWVKTQFSRYKMYFLR